MPTASLADEVFSEFCLYFVGDRLDVGIAEGDELLRRFLATEFEYAMYSRIEQSASSAVKSPTSASSAAYELPGIVPSGFTFTPLLWK